MEHTLHKLSVYCRKLRIVTQSPLPPENKLEKVIREGIALEDELKNLDDRLLPKTWPPLADLKHRASGEIKYEHILPGKVLEEDISLYAAIRRGVMINIYRAMRLHLIHKLSEALLVVDQNTTSLDTKMLRAGWADIEGRLADSICDDLPFVLGHLDLDGRPLHHPVSGAPFRAYIMLWPLQVAIGSKGINPERKQMLIEKLHYIGKVNGIGLASDLASITSSHLLEPSASLVI